MPRGGDQSAKAKANGKKMGRPKLEAEEATVGKGFATRVMARIKELKLNGIASAEDYALDILKAQDAEARSFFRYMLDRQFDKPVQAVIQRDTRENVPELEFGDLRMPSGPEPGKTGKPN